jgi:predicted nucleic acid-binding protein
VLAIDASLAVELALDRAGERASADLSRGGELIAPPLLWREVPSALHELAFRDEISNALAELALQRFLSGRLSIGAASSPSTAGSAVEPTASVS